MWVVVARGGAGAMKGRGSVSAREKGGRSRSGLSPDAELEVPWGPRGLGVQGDRRLHLVGRPSLQPLVLGPAAAPSHPPAGSHARVQVLQKSPLRPVSLRSDRQLSRGLVEKGGSLGKGFEEH